MFKKMQLGKIAARMAILSVSAALAAACGTFDDDEPPGDDAGQDTDGPSSCADQFDGFDPALLQNVCPSPYAPQYTVSLEGADILWMDDPANATTVGPGGWVFGNTAQADWLGWISQGDQECGIACTLPQGHPCFGGDTFCFGGPAEAQCTFCGVGGYTPEECGEFVESCWGPNGGVGDDTGAADTGSGGGAADTGSGGGAADTGSGGAGAGPSVPDDTIFRNNPNALFGTTQVVLDLFGSAAPPNLVAEDMCAIWDPENAVEHWFSESLLKKELLEQTLGNAEKFLGYCDHLKLRMVANGVKLVAFDRRSLASELGFQIDDVLLSLNGVPATDPFALQREIIEISQDSPGVGSISYLRQGRLDTITIRVE